LKQLLAALVGGFAGALVTGGLSLWLEHRRQRRALRVAARLVAGELRTIESRLHVVVGSGTWRELRVRSLAHGEWDEHCSAFAAQLPLERWSDLHSAYGLVASVNLAARLHEELDRLTEVEREVLETAAQSAGAAAATLETKSLAGANGPGRPHGRAQRMLLRHP
jgi:hypothetical protein